MQELITINHPNQWRDTMDISTLPFHQVQILEILGYPHAGNDVFHVRLLHRQTELNAFVKVERQQGADIGNEIRILSALPLSLAPTVIEYSLDAPCYIVTKESPGERLSAIVRNQPGIDRKPYLHKQAGLLSQLHRMEIDCDPVKDRRFFHVPTADFCKQHSLEHVHSFLQSKAPPKSTTCFVHGDFHYANMLWEHGEISCVLDYELSGKGIREFDMAWSIFLRPGQAFGASWEDVMAFLKGYEGHYHLGAFCYYYVQIAAHFFPLGDDDYRRDVVRLMNHGMGVFHTEGENS